MNFKNRLSLSIRKTNRRAVALLAIFAIALSGTGLASLAVLTDTVTTTVNASITTIDLNVNGTKSATINLADGAIPGDVRYASLHFTNSGTGYVNVPSSVSIQAGAGQLTSDSVMKVWNAVSPANCSAAGGVTAAGGQPLTTAPWDNQPVIAAGDSMDVCFVYRLGTTGAEYTDGISAFQLLYSFPAFYP